MGVKKVHFIFLSPELVAKIKSTIEEDDVEGLECSGLLELIALSLSEEEESELIEALKGAELAQK